MTGPPKDGPHTRREQRRHWMCFSKSTEFFNGHTSPFIYLHTGSVFLFSYRMKKVKSCAILLFFHLHTALPWSDELLPLSFFLVRSGDGLAREHRVWEEVPRLPSSDGFLGSILLREW